MPVYADDLPYLFGLIAKGLGAKTSQEAEQEKRDQALKGLGQFFQTSQASYSQPSMGRPDVGFKGLTQPITPSSVNFNTVPTTPNLGNFDFLSALMNYGQLGGDAASIAKYVTPTTTPINQEAGGLDILQSYPTGKYTINQAIPPDRSLMRQVSMGQPTELAKHQSELAAIRASNPNDPRIPEYEAVIKKLQIGVPNFQVRPGAEGQYIPYDVKTGEFVDKGPPQFQPTPTQVRQAAAQLQNVSQSANKISEIVNRASITGPVSGRARKLGSRFFSDKDAQALISTVGQLRPIIYGLSGKQINEAELKWLNEEILPHIAQPDENFDVSLGIFKNWVSQTLGNLQTQFPSLQIKGKTSDIDAEIQALEKELGITK